VISTLHDAATFFMKWKEEETVLDVLIALLDSHIESAAVVRCFRGEWLELATNSDTTLIRIYLPSIVKFEFITSADMPAVTHKGRPAPRIAHGWLLSTAHGVVYLISELDDPGAQVDGRFQS